MDTVSTLILFISRVFVFFLATEVAAYLLHRFLFHGPLWFIHRTHHEPSHGLFEWNDLFSAGFAAAAIAGIFSGLSNPLQSLSFAAGTGVTLYGLVYFVLHDILTHGRFFRFRARAKWARLIRNAHRVHHTDTGKQGLEPYGLLLFVYRRYRVR